MSCRRYALIMMTMLLCAGCDKAREVKPIEDDAARQSEVERRLPEGAERVEDLFAQSELMYEFVPVDASKNTSQVVDLVVDKIKARRLEKQLALSSSTRPSGSRPASELARLLLSPGPILATDFPTNDLELTALAVATLKLHGIASSPAVQISHSDEVQLEHVVLAVPGAGAQSPRYIDMTRLDVSDDAVFEEITELDALGIHLARRAALLFLIGKPVDAKKDLDAAFVLAPTMATPYFVRASMLVDVDPRQTVSDLSRVALRKSSPQVWLLLGRTQRQQGKHRQSVELLSQIQPDHELYDEAQIELARSACAQGDLAQFLVHMELATQADATRREAYRDVVLVASAHGYDDLAQQALRAGIRVSPELPLWKVLAGIKGVPAAQWPAELIALQDELGACAHAESPPAEPPPEESPVVEDLD